MAKWSVRLLTGKECVCNKMLRNQIFNGIPVLYDLTLQNPITCEDGAIISYRPPVKFKLCSIILGGVKMNYIAWIKGIQ